MKFNCKTPKELLKKIKNEDIKMVDLRFVDIPGTSQHFTIPIKFLEEKIDCITAFLTSSNPHHLLNI